VHLLQWGHEVRVAGTGSEFIGAISVCVYMHAGFCREEPGKATPVGAAHVVSVLQQVLDEVRASALHRVTDLSSLVMHSIDKMEWLTMSCFNVVAMLIALV
jgi:molybdopterin synthase catalytic subunit